MNLSIMKRLTLPTLLFHQGIISIFDHMFCSTLKHFYHYWPFFAYLFNLSEEKKVFFFTPALFTNNWVKMVAPSLSTLSICSEVTAFWFTVELKRDFLPLILTTRPFLLIHNCFENLVFLFLPLELSFRGLTEDTDGLVSQEYRCLFSEDCLKEIKIETILS